MPINTVIRDKRKELGLTQEQIANHLGVTAPAVNKWEKGLSCPDIMLLSPLARLLQVDLNTLLCFNDNLTEQEVIVFMQEIQEALKKEGFEEGFALAKERIQEYPNCTLLIYSAAVILEGAMAMAGSSLGNREKYEEQLLFWYEWCAVKEEKDIKVRDAAKTMLITRYMSAEKYDEAQNLIESLPECPVIDKRLFQCDLLIRQDRAKEACNLLQRKLLQQVGEIQGILTRLIDMEIDRGRAENAEGLAEIAHKAAELFDMWEFSRFEPLLHVALAKKDVEKSVMFLKHLLSALLRPWNLQDSLLYYEVGSRDVWGMGSKFLSPLIEELENNSEYDFLRGENEFSILIARYREYLNKTENFKDNADEMKKCE